MAAKSARKLFAFNSSEGFPDIKHEEWKYTNVTPIAKEDFAPVLASNGTP